MNKNFTFILILFALFSIVKANDGWINCNALGTNATTFDVEFSPDPITSPGPKTTNFKISGKIGNLAGENTFTIEVNIATHSSVSKDHTLLFNIVDGSELIGCITFPRSAFTD
ncbi:9067_t:CDS:2 [Gigaspora margarita]|uniref:9067_t:CDS:1 n=1 Tax=Gigaspora margarita TaxID=4874 RepID=A0ABN7V0P3_GIGMA|nr:9067_t:CDS:2 [Gigaspora margarita]